MKTRLLRRLRKQYYSRFYIVRKKENNGYSYVLRTGMDIFGSYDSIDEARKACDRIVHLCVRQRAENERDKRSLTYPANPSYPYRA